MTTAEEYEEAEESMGQLAELARQEEEERTKVEQALGTKLKSINDYVMSDYEAITTLSKNLNINATDGKEDA